jgi:hypothetical protein
MAHSRGRWQAERTLALEHYNAFRIAQNCETSMKRTLQFQKNVATFRRICCEASKTRYGGQKNKYDASKKAVSTPVGNRWLRECAR